MQLSIVIPAYNEEERIGLSLQKILDFGKREFDACEVLVVDDGSTDRTVEVVESFSEVRCLQNVSNQGKGRSVCRGVMAATLDPVLFTDTDLSTPIEEALDLLNAIRGGADVAVGSRGFGGGKIVQRKHFRRLRASVFRWTVKLFALRGFHDTQCGFKMFRRQAARRVFALQRLDGWAFDVELLLISRLLGYSIREVPVEWHESTRSSVPIWGPFQMVVDLVKVRWFQLRGLYRPCAEEEEIKT